MASAHEEIVETPCRSRICFWIGLFVRSHGTAVEFGKHIVSEDTIGKRIVSD